jgi:hypothetical protein
MGTFFQSRVSNGGTMPIDAVVAWSRTARGGKQLPLLEEPPDGGCFRWGLCEPPSPPEEQASAASDDDAEPDSERFFEQLDASSEPDTDP